jgi:hypothetical protein
LAGRTSNRGEGRLVPSILANPYSLAPWYPIGSAEMAAWNNFKVDLNVVSVYKHGQEAEDGSLIGSNGIGTGS